MTQYNIGQKRFQGSGCIEEVNDISIRYQSVSMSDDSDSSSTGFQDVAIYPNGDGAFIQGQDYYLKVRIPQDMNYDMTFNIKLMPPNDGSSDTKKYQFVKKISMSRGGTGTNVYNVVLYEKSDGQIAVDFPLTYNKSVKSQKDKIYTDKTNYYLGKDNTYVRTTKFNDVALAASWKTENAETYGVFEMVFRPLNGEFTSLLLEMERTAEDYNIQRVNDEGKTEYGRKISLTTDNIELYKLINQVPSSLADKQGLSRIGVWGHPGLVMAINGEEIRVGPSGYYEQDVVAIKSIGVVAKDKDWAANWTLDYEYITTEEEEESV